MRKAPRVGTRKFLEHARPTRDRQNPQGQMLGCAPPGHDGCASFNPLACAPPDCFKPPFAAGSKCLIGCAIKGPVEGSVSAMKKLESLKVESNRFVVAFCGSGTGHLTQAMKAVEILEARGFTLAGVVTDTDAAEKMLDEMVRPLGVELLVIPAIELVDTETGFIPLNNPVRFVGSLIKSQEYLLKNAADIADFFARARASKIFNMYHLTLARFFQLNPLPPSIEITHMAAQFGLCALTYEDTRTFLEVGGKAVMDVMSAIFAASGQTIPIGPTGGENILPPIIHLPAPLQPRTPRLILCYFLVQTNAKALDAILAKKPIANCEVSETGCGRRLPPTSISAQPLACNLVLTVGAACHSHSSIASLPSRSTKPTASFARTRSSGRSSRSSLPSAPASSCRRGMRPFGRRYAVACPCSRSRPRRTGSSCSMRPCTRATSPHSCVPGRCSARRT